MNEKKVVLTGIKPTGSPHLGNYLGAIRPALELAARPDTVPLYFIADYHAVTSVHDKERLRHLTYEVAATWLACGLDPERCLFYRQSDIPEVFELSWLLSCFTPKGFMNKMHAYKAAVADNEAAGRDPDDGVNIGLYTYPILMAADIVLFDCDLVPVGRDQVQHVEIARDIAERLNRALKNKKALRLPRPMVVEQAAVVTGLDGRKMSKSYDNTLPLFAPPKTLRKLINGIRTDSRPADAPKDPAESLIFELYKGLASPEDTQALAERYQAGISWGEAKQALFEAFERQFAEPRERYAELMANPERIDALLNEGAERARAIARRVLQRVRDALGSTAQRLII
ncbi:MAG: tryptophan--tRNA ligase [Myxococcales bacterium]|nr:tryptophan--tRNA ligase [Myxococcales bacterium]